LLEHGTLYKVTKLTPNLQQRYQHCSHKLCGSCPLFASKGFAEQHDGSASFTNNTRCSTLGLLLLLETMVAQAVRSVIFKHHKNWAAWHTDSLVFYAN